MKKRFIFAMVLANMALGTIAQTPQFTVTDSSNKPVDYDLDSLFSQLDLSGITSGYLLDKCVTTANVASSRFCVLVITRTQVNNS